MMTLLVFALFYRKIKGVTMKRTLVLLFLGFAAFALNAQSNCAQKKACCQAKAVQTSLSDTDLKSAVHLASLDETIEVRKDEANGQTQFVRKQVCPMSGAVSYVDLQFDAEKQQFINVAPAAMEASTSETAMATKSCDKPCDKPCAEKPCPLGCCAGKTEASAAPQSLKASQSIEIKPGMRTSSSKKTKVQ